MKLYAGVRVYDRVHSLFSMTLQHQIAAFVRLVLHQERIKRDVVLDIFITTCREMQAVHERSTGKAFPTDALTFHESSVTSALISQILFTSAEFNYSTHASLNSGAGVWAATRWSYGRKLEQSPRSMLRLGELYLCPDYMIARTRRLPHRSLPLVPYFQSAVVHALLHALGYDHEAAWDFREMVKKEQQTGLKLLQSQRRQNRIFFASCDFSLYSKSRRARNRVQRGDIRLTTN